MKLTATRAIQLVRTLPARVGREIASWAVARTSRTDMCRLGTNYGGWWVPSDLLSEQSVCYLAGVGEDTSFDLALVQRFKCDVWAFDPTPRSVAHVEKISEPRFHFIPVGLWSEDTSMVFYEPANAEHVSHSITNIQRTSGGFEAKCRTVRSLMSELGHNHIDLLKLDIEGAEVAVLASLLQDQILPRVLCVEFDAVEPPWRLARRFRSLASVGYRACQREGRNYTFVLSE